METESLVQRNQLNSGESFNNAANNFEELKHNIPP